jgi:hypothetical protein
MSSARRASTQMIASPTEDGYGTDDEKKTNRRASLSGPIARRRSSVQQGSRRQERRRQSTKGINPDVVASLSFAQPGERVNPENDDSSSSSSSHQREKHYGYRDNYPRPRMEGSRRNSASSIHSKRSRRSSVTVARGKQNGQKPKLTSQKSYSDMSGASESDVEGTTPNAFGYESDCLGSGSEMGRSVTSKMARRRNSVVPMEKSADDSADVIFFVTGELDPSVNENEEMPVREKEPIPTKSHDSSKAGQQTKNVQISADQGSSWRKSPLTISYAAPTQENLRDISRIKLDPGPVPRKENNQYRYGPSSHDKDGWGTLEINDGSSDEKSSSQNSYGASLYTKENVDEEIDQYKQKARRRASMENGELFDLGDAEHMKELIPHFTPAQGCYNASDFVVRCFTARLRTTGFTVLKHNRSRWSKAKHRILYLLPDGKTLSWKIPGDGADEENGGKLKSSQTSTSSKNVKYPKIDLSTCLEVRHAWTKDPTSKDNKRGTPVLRQRLSTSQLASKSFSLIFKSRTLDLTAFSNDQCKVMMEGFSALCFRLQLKESEENDSSNTFSKPPNEEDWASTVYGSVSLSLTNTSATAPASITPTSSPWGL